MKKFLSIITYNVDSSSFSAIFIDLSDRNTLWKTVSEYQQYVDKLWDKYLL